MNQRQRENTARYLYDLSKIVLATAVVGNLIAGKSFDVLISLIGSPIAYLLFWWGHILDGVKE